MRIDEEKAKPRAILVLDGADLAVLQSGKAIDFDVEVGGSKERCQLLQTGASSNAANVAHRLFIDAGAINAVSIGGAAVPIFDGVPFSVRLEAAPGLVPEAVPVQLSPGVTYRRANVAEHAPVPERARSKTRLSFTARAGFVVCALVCLGVAIALRDHSAVYGFGLMGIGSLWVAFRDD